MKKLMIAAAVAAMTAGAYAADFLPINCEEPLEPTSCPLMVFKLTGSGKTVQNYKGEYKTVKTLKISKGALVLTPDEAMAEDCGICCYATAEILATVKVGSTTHYVDILDVPVTKWSVFGKNLDKVINFLTEMKKGSSVSLESDLYLEADDAEIYFAGADDDDDGLITAVTFKAAAFGTMTAKNLKAGTTSTNYCVTPDPVECVLEFTPKTYNGWFAGNYDVCVHDSQLCFNCECGEYDIFGGTWKAVFQAKTKTLPQILKLAFGSKAVDFGEEE